MDSPKEVVVVAVVVCTRPSYTKYVYTVVLSLVYGVRRTQLRYTTPAGNMVPGTRLIFTSDSKGDHIVGQRGNSMRARC